MDLRPCSNRFLIDQLSDPGPYRYYYYNLGATLDHQQNNTLQRVVGGGSSDGDGDGMMNLSNTPSSVGSPIDHGAAGSPSPFLLQYHQHRPHPQPQQILHSRSSTGGNPRAVSDPASCLIVSSSTAPTANALDDRSRQQQNNQYSPLLSGVSTTTNGSMSFFDADQLVDETFENETGNQDNGNPAVITRQSSSATIVVSSPGTKLYPSTHPLGLAKHICSICGDRASGKHYGVHR